MAAAVDGALLREPERARTLCADFSCWRRLCREAHCSTNFCCYMCERRHFGEDLGAAHGQACSKKEKPPWDACRAIAQPSPSSSLTPTAPVDLGVGHGAMPWHQPAHAWNPAPPVASVGADCDPEYNEVPLGLLWEVTADVIRDDQARKVIDRFLKKCWTAALKSASEKASVAPMTRLETFVREWVTDTLFRYHQAQGSEGFRYALPLEVSIMLFQKLCELGAAPRQIIRSIGVEPPRSWPFVQKVVESVYHQLGFGRMVERQPEMHRGPNQWNARVTLVAGAAPRTGVGGAGDGWYSAWTSTPERPAPCAYATTSPPAAAPASSYPYQRLDPPYRASAGASGGVGAPPPPAKRRRPASGRVAEATKAARAATEAAQRACQSEAAGTGEAPPVTAAPDDTIDAPSDGDEEVADWGEGDDERNAVKVQPEVLEMDEESGDLADEEEDPPGHRGCTCQEKCVGKPEDALVSILSPYVGHFCTSCYEILKNNDDRRFILADDVHSEAEQRPS